MKARPCPQPLALRAAQHRTSQMTVKWFLTTDFDGLRLERDTLER